MYRGINPKLHEAIAQRRAKLKLFEMDGEELKMRRNGLGFSEVGLASIFGVRAGSVRKWEDGTSSIPDWVDLALEAMERRIADGAFAPVEPERIEEESARENSGAEAEKAKAKKHRKLQILFGDE